ncbi:MAG TPA: xanthine dehydrogenase family protein molybdopterin-binding subunit [Beijerinckiaceae bacterium]|nr:xanthine dehydrogenase family protein molybdopterin-binding subunit [Beijerinckiaceae bacterium]
MPRYAIGQGVTSVESLKLVAGHGRYTDDVSFPGECHAIFVRSPHAHADIKSIDARKAKQMPGVVEILTGEDYANEGLGIMLGNEPPKRRNGSPAYRPPRPALSRDKVRHIGQCVAVVIAETIHQAKDAAEAVEVDFAPLPPQLDAESAHRPDAPRIWPDCEHNEAFVVERGNAAKTDAALKAAPHVVSDRFLVSRVSANPMEPRAAVAEYDPGRRHFRIFACQQRPFVWRSMMAEPIFKIGEHEMTVIACDVGGSFGMKGGLYPEVVIAAWAARKVGRPVKWVCERSEAFISDEQARDIVVTGELGFDDEGRFLAERVDCEANIGAFLSMAGFGVAAGTAAAALCGTYDFPTVHGRSAAVFTNKCPIGNYRAPSGVPGAYVLERLIDMAAKKIGLDPTEIRRRNFIKPTAMPVKLPNGASYDCGEFEAVMDKCLQMADYAGIAVRRAAAEARGRLLGVGVSSSVDPSGSPAPECAELRFNPGGTVTVLAASTAGGQGHATIYTQIVSQTLGLDADKITVVEGDTSVMAWGSGTGAARTATLSGSVVLMAAQKVREKGRRIAAHLLEAAVGDIEFENGTYRVAGTDRTIAFDDIARIAFQPTKLPKGMEFGLYETASWQPETLNIPNSFHVCEVEIDPDTGHVQLMRYSCIQDVGVELNPALVIGQARGGITQALGQALMESIIYDDDGQVVSGSFMDYGMPHATDVCAMQIASHPVPTKTNPLGVKGAGETATVGALAAVMNAINNALEPFGVSNISMPATPEKVWRAICDAQATNALRECN